MRKSTRQNFLQQEELQLLREKSLMQLSQSKALQYKSERSHMKSVVALQNKVTRVNRDAEKMLSRLTEECKEKVEAAE